MKRGVRRALPRRVCVAPGAFFAVREEVLEGKLGYCDPKKMEIVVDSRLPWPGKNSILLHELLHVVEEKLLAAGVISRRPSHDYVTHASGVLFAILATSGLWNGVTPEEALAFALAPDKPPRRRVARARG